VLGRGAAERGLWEGSDRRWWQGLALTSDVVLNENDIYTGWPGATAEFRIWDGVRPMNRLIDRLR
jgi:hypothetical protein